MLEKFVGKNSTSTTSLFLKGKGHNTLDIFNLPFVTETDQQVFVHDVS